MKVFHKVNVSNRENVLQRTDRTEILEQTGLHFQSIWRHKF